MSATRRPSVSHSIAAIAGVLLLSATAAGETKDRLPKFAAVEKLVHEQFADQPDRLPGDIISQADVVPIFQAIDKKLHWKVADQAAIVKLVPRDNELLVTKLRTTAGRKFMRTMSDIPQGYDRLDHLSRLPDARTLLDRLIKGPDGYKLIDYLAETSGGTAMGKMLSQAPGGKGFNKPTGRLYTVDQFLARLRVSHDAARELRDDPKAGGASSR
jgi:hypothetical protein